MNGQSPTIDPAFLSTVGSEALLRLERSSDVVYGIRPDFRLAYVNRGWYRFAAANGGDPGIRAHWSLGRDIREAIPDIVLDFYVGAYRACLESGEPWEHDFECSSPDTLRLYHQRVVRLGDGEGLLVVNSLRHEGGIPLEPWKPDPRYVARDGLIRQCVHCRRVRRGESNRTWDWVPAWVADPPRNVSHGLCGTCAELHPW